LFLSSFLWSGRVGRTDTIVDVRQVLVRRPQNRLAIGVFIVLVGPLILGILPGKPKSVWAQTQAGVSQGAPVTIWDGVYTEAQARRGEEVFKTACSYCHKDNLAGGFFDDGLGRAPALAGKRAFDSSLVERWGGMTLADMVGTVAATMPQQRPSSLSVENYVDVVSYILSKNEAPAGASELSGDVETLSRISIPNK
jgi:mono/diheme cytochrome c family protein